MPIMYKDGDKMRKIAKIMYLDNITNTIKTVTSCKGLVDGKLLDFLSSGINPKMESYSAVEVENNTTLTTSVNTKMGDYILATITARSALTLPADWTLLKTLGPVDIGDTNQTMSFAYKKVQMDGDISLTVTQLNSVRMYLTLIVLSGINGIEYANEYEKVVKEEVTSVTTIDKKQGEKLIWGCSAVTWKTNGGWSNAQLGMGTQGSGIGIDWSYTPQRQTNFLDFGKVVTTNTFKTPYINTECIVGAVRLK